jgi:hypothetical protein
MRCSGSTPQVRGLRWFNMKKLLFVIGAAALVACMHERDSDNNATVNEPAGAAISTNSMQSMPARDINQQPYPGSSDLNQQRGSGSTSDSSLQGASGSSTSGSSSSDSSSQNP